MSVSCHFLQTNIGFLSFFIEKYKIMAFSLTNLKYIDLLQWTDPKTPYLLFLIDYKPNINKSWTQRTWLNLSSLVSIIHEKLNLKQREVRSHPHKSYRKTTSTTSRICLSFQSRFPDRQNPATNTCWWS